jgi:hypothetical protein
MMKLIVAFRNFSNAPKNVRYTGVHCKSSMYEFRMFYANERITRRETKERIFIWLYVSSVGPGLVPF